MHDEDQLAPMRGMRNGILFSLPLWAFLIGMGWYVWRCFQ